MSETMRPHAGRKVEKPWGHELVWAETARYVGKILHIESGEALSLQYHEVKEETLHVLSGRLRIEVGDHESALTSYEIGPGETIHMPPQRRHRMTALQTCDILEVSTPELDDVVRLSDRYGRAGTKVP